MTESENILLEKLEVNLLSSQQTANLLLNEININLDIVQKLKNDQEKKQ